MLDFFNKFLRPAQPSGATAKERLRLVLLSDHLSLAPDVVEALKADLLGVISRYVEIDRAHADVTFEQRAGELAMLASVPITGVRRVPYEAALPPPPPPAPVSPDPARTAASRAPAAVVSERIPASEPQALELPMASEPTAAVKASHAARRRRRRRKANAAAKRNAQQQGAVQQMNTTAQA